MHDPTNGSCPANADARNHCSCENPIQYGGATKPWNRIWFEEFKTDTGADIALFKIGDFYEAFFEDAVFVAKSLGLTLTTRNPKGSKDEIPMTGFPYHQLDAYVTKLVSLGKRITVCEQVK